MDFVAVGMEGNLGWLVTRWMVGDVGIFGHGGDCWVLVVGVFYLSWVPFLDFGFSLILAVIGFIK
jgi:hypothetical protein